MTEDAQRGLGDYADGDRPVTDEAQAVAGSDSVTADVVDAEQFRYPDADGEIEIAVTQVDYTIEGSGNDEFPVVHVFGRTPGEQSLVHVKVYEFRPYFYAPTANLDFDDLGSRDRITGWESGYESIRGEDLTKIFGQTPRDVGQIRDEFDHYEADILFPNRLLIDKDIKSGVRVPERRTGEDTIRIPHDEIEPVDVDAEPRVSTFDIEVDDRSGFPEDGEESIICIASHDSYRDEYVLWLYDADEGSTVPERLDGYEPLEDDEMDVDIRVFEAEPAMLDAFVSYLSETSDPDIITGWNCLPADSEVLMADGSETEIQNLEIGDEVVGNEGQTTRAATVTNTWRSEKSIFEFNLKDGTTFRSSGDHRVMIGDDQAVDWKRAGEIEPGDFVLKPRRLNVDSTVVPTLSELIPTDRQRFTEETVREFKQSFPYGGVTDLSSEFDVSTGTLQQSNPTVWNLERCRHAAEKFDIPVPDGGHVHKRTGRELDRELTQDELYFAGLVLTDGSMSTDDGIRFYNTRRELHEAFPGENHLEADGKGCYKQNVLDFTRMYAFHGLGIPFGNKNAEKVHLSTVYEMPRPYIARFLAGIIDGDGHVSSHVSVAAENRSIGSWYVKLFRRLGIYAEQNENVVRIPDAEHEIERLQSEVLPHMRHPQKVSRLEAMNGGKSGRSETIPYALFEAAEGSDVRRIGRDKHRRGIGLKRHETDIEEWEKYVFVEVESIETSGTETTYDIETTTHNFIADDCLVHNCDDFDAPYLIDRLEVLDPTTDYNLDFDRLSRVDEVWRSDWQGPDIKGRVVFDLLRAYKRTQFTELESYRLEAVGEQELGAGKETYTGDIGDLWEDDPERLLEYNLRDVELCVELDRKQDIIAFFQEIASFVGCKLEDAPTPGDAVDMYVLHKAHGRFALPSKGTVESGEEFEGGAVFDPITGVEEMVSVLDLKSLYPMCMVTINASPETIIDPEEHDGETFVAPNGQHFRKEPDGIIREMVTELLSEREEKKELRNQHDPDTEVYEQYDRQQASVKVIMNCFTPDTEVLTPEGVRNIRELEVGDSVYSIDPQTLEMERKPVVETHAYPDYDGGIVEMETSKIDFGVTPNHRMLVRKAETNGIAWDEDDYRFVEAGDLERGTNYQLPHDWEGPDGERVDEVDLTELVDEYEVWVRPDVHGHTFAAEIGYYPDTVLKNDIGSEGYVFDAAEFEEHREYIDSVAEQCFVHTESNRKWIPRTYDGDDFLELLAWYVTEGSVYTSEEKQSGDELRGSATSVQIAQDEPTVTDGGESDHAAIGDLLDRMGFDYYVDEQGYQFTSRLLGNLLEDIAGEGSHEKRIPEFVFESSNGQKRQFLETLIDGDGDRQPHSWRYSTASERLRDDVLRLCAHLGLTASYNEDSGVYRIYVTEDAKNTLRMNRSGSRTQAEDGVYCVTVADNHTLLAGRNGKFQWVGQSLYGVSGWDRFRLYDKDSAAAVTATGRAVIDHTENAVEDMGYEVAYGDSVTGERPVVVRDPDGRVQITPIADLFEAADPISSHEIRITADGGDVASTTPGKDRRLLDGWEALSLNETGEAEWKPIQQVIRHEVDDGVVTLQHKFGESTTTHDHSYVVEDGNEYIEASPEEVPEPLRIPGVPDIEDVGVIDVYEVLDGYTRTYEDGRSVGSADATKKTKRVHADENRVWFGHEHHNGLDKTVTVQRYVDIESEDGRALIRLLAAYIAEGSASTVETTASRFGASIAESSREWLEQLQDDYHRLFDNATASIVVGDANDERAVEYDTSEGQKRATYDDRTNKLQMMNELAAVFCREFAGQTSRGKRIPSFVFHLPDDEQQLFLDVLVEGDSSREFPRYSDEYAAENFDYETTSRELAAGLSILLTQRDRKHSLKYRESKDSYTIRTCQFYRSGREPVIREQDHEGYVYDLSVSENQNFVDAVGGIVLHNTDSVMISLADEASTVEDAIDQSFDIEEAINASYDEFARKELEADEHRFQIEFEKLYRRFFQAGKKKRYAGHIVWKEGKEVDDVDITGFEYQRSDIASITKEVQLQVLEMIVKEGDIEGVTDYLNGVIEDFLEGNMALEKVAIPGGIGKRLDNYDTDTAQVRGAKYANLLLGTNFQRGSKPKRLYLEKVHPEFFRRVEREMNLDPAEDPLYGEFKRNPDVICFEYNEQIPEEFEVDWEKMLDKTLKGPIERVIEALGISWDEVKSGQEQTGLGQFM